MASNDDVGVCKWCAGDTGYDWNNEEEPEESTKAPRKWHDFVITNQFKYKLMDKIRIEIKCSSNTCEELRKQGLFFISIAELLDIDREDIIELEKEWHDFVSRLMLLVL